MKKNKIINTISTIIIILIIIVSAIGTSKYSKNHTPLSNSDIKLDFDMSKWNYDKNNNIYYQLGVNYCAKPKDTDFESLGIYVPGEYLNGKKNQNGTYTCTINKKGEKAGYTSDSAPIIISINTLEYQAQKAPKTYNYADIDDYMKLGYIYVLPGTRGIIDDKKDDVSEEYNGKIIEGVTDLKSVVKFCRFNKNILPGNSERIFSFGINGGGTKSAILGASGDSELYYSELISIGAIMENEDGSIISDSVNGAMCWTPTLNLENAKESYAWNIGQYFNKDKNIINEEKSNKELALNFADYINDMKFKSEDGTLLYLEKSNKGIYIDGTYYNYILNEVEIALNSFLANTTFPYTNKEKGITYKTKRDYINYLNSDTKWIIYNQDTDKVKLTSIKDFVLNCKIEKKENINQTSSDACNPLYFLSSNYDGEGSSYIARYWNICTEVDKEDIDFSAEENLKFVLENNEDVRKVKYTSVWGREYPLEEKQKIAIENLKLWIEDCY